MFVVPPPAPLLVVPGAPGSLDTSTPSWMPTEVVVDADYQRIAALPRMEWDQAPDLEQVVYTLTNLLRLPGPPCGFCSGRWYSMDKTAPPCPECGRPTLKPVQAAALRALYDCRGVFGSMRVGSGKTLCTLLGPTLLGAHRPGLVIQADLREKTFHDIREASRWWRVHPAFQAVAIMTKSERKDQRTILSYEELQVKNGGVKLVQAAWDSMNLDEFQNIKDRSTARHKKIKRGWKHYRPITAVYSGSASTRGFGDFWAPLRWALGDQSPLPLELKSFLSWCYSLDEKVPDAARLHPGPLVDLTPGAKGRDDWERAQDAFGRRFVSAPGVISTKDDVPPFGLQIEVVHVPAPAPVRAAVQLLRQNWETPDGNEFQHAFELWQRERWMSRGGWFAWDPQPPMEWRAARKSKNAFIREALRLYSRTMDSSAMVEDAIDAGKIDDSGVLAWWREVKPMFDEDSSEWSWLPAGSYALIEDAIAWLKKHPRHGICWVIHEPIGNAVARAAGVPYYAEGALNAAGEHIMQATTSCVASIRSCGTGKNLQHEFYLNNFLELPTTGVGMEQTVGRTHRDKQAVSDTVHVRIPIMTTGDLRGLQQTIADAQRIQRTEQIPQKLCYGTWHGFDLARELELL